jgi:hypothetical protein
MAVGFDLFTRRKDGSDFPAHIELAPLHTEDGLLVMAAVRDTTGWQPGAIFARGGEAVGAAEARTVLTVDGWFRTGGWCGPV